MDFNKMPYGQLVAVMSLLNGNINKVKKTTSV